MNLSKKGNATTYYAGYKANAKGSNFGIGLWTNDNNHGNIDDVAWLQPGDNGKDELHINMKQIAYQGIGLVAENVDAKTMADIIAAGDMNIDDILNELAAKIQK